MDENEYRYECETLEGFVQRVVVLSQKGYHHFIAGVVPERKDPGDVDEKLLQKYDVGYSRRQRYRRKRRGLSNVHYFRHGARWVLMATAGEHVLFERGARERVFDLRETPIRVGPYSISLRRDGSAGRAGVHRVRAHVRLAHEAYVLLRDEFLELAVHRSREDLEARIWNVPYEPFAPVYRQLRAIVWRVNERRKAAGFEPVRLSCIRFSRRLPKHFEGPSVEEWRAA
jgi:hypothetical protein